MASPAAAAQVSRVLAKAGIPKARELRKGVESTGYVVEPHAAHVQVEYVSFTGKIAEQRAGLAKCLAALEGKYDVKLVFGLVVAPGGWTNGHYLKVTSNRWEA